MKTILVLILATMFAGPIVSIPKVGAKDSKESSSGSDEVLTSSNSGSDSRSSFSG